MSANRRQGCPTNINWQGFLERCSEKPVCRVQGRRRDATSNSGRLVRFNRAVRVLVSGARNFYNGPEVQVHRVQWNHVLGVWQDIPEELFTVRWTDLDYVTWKASGDPNYTWQKVV